jgi:hypothetical protein
MESALVEVKGIMDVVARWFYFQTKNIHFGTFLKALQWTILVYFTAIWYI